MAESLVKINSILGGISPSQYFFREGQFLASIGVDPDYPITSSDVRTSGAIVPTVYEKFSGSNVNASVIAIINTPKTSLTYLVLSNGRLISYDSSLGSETLIGTVSGGAAYGGFYYNNFIYIPTATDVSQYGPLDGSASLTDGVWTGAKFGLTALTNTTYPSLNGLAIPQHWGCVAADGAAYFCDFKNGQGFINRLSTKKGTSEGDTNDTTIPSSYQTLKLPYGYYPVAVCPYSTDLCILAIQTTSSTINQGPAALFFWTTTNTSTFYRGPVPIPDPIGTALLNTNGGIYIWSGNASSGVRVSQYDGGDAVKDIAYIEEGFPPFAGAVDAVGGKVTWGASTTYPVASASVYALGSKRFDLAAGLHNVVKTTSSGANPNVTALKYVQQASNITPRMIVAWADDSAKGVDKLSTTNTYGSVWRSQLIQVGSTFKFLRLRIPFGKAISANMTLTVKIYVDDGSSSSTLSTINNTNFSGKRYVHFKGPDLSSIGGVSNFFLEFTWSGTVSLPVLLPIECELDVYPDDP